MKRTTIILLAVLAVSAGLFAGYLFGIRNLLDTEPPVITVEDGLLELSVKDPQEALFQGITAMDQRDGDVTDSLMVESIYGINDDNITTVTYAAMDSRGNVSRHQRKICYRDYESPKFEVYTSLTFTSGSSFDLMNCVGARDVLEGDIRRRVRATVVSESRSIYSVGTHQVQFQVTNSLGDTSELVLPVEVMESGWFNAGVELTKYLVYLKPGESFDANAYWKSFVVRGEAIDINSPAAQSVVRDISGTVDTSTPGVYEVSYTLSQNDHMSSFVGRAKLIVIVQE